LTSRSLKALRGQAVDAVKERWAILALANDPSRPTSDELARHLAEVRACVSPRQLREHLHTIQSQIKTLRRGFGVKASRDELLTWIEMASEPGQVYCWRQVADVSEMLSHYDSYDYPAHAWISTDPNGIQRGPSFEVRLLEATFFEDMAMLFNMARDTAALVGHSSAASSDKKRGSALNRAAAVAAFSFVESFLNGLATDHLHKNGSNLGEKDRDVLSDRRRRDGMKDKLLKYPRVILGTTEPPLCEENCPELTFVVKAAERLRHAIVHPIAGTAGSGRSPERDVALFYLQHSEIELLVDNVIALARRILKVIGKPEPAWLLDRGKDGFFPRETFD
jgi:hypothetical protein